MATKQKELDEKLRQSIVEKIYQFLKEEGEDVRYTASNVLMFPCLDEEEGERFCSITVKIPTGSRDGEEYDGYGEAESYEMHLKEQAEKKAKKEAEKQKKIERDKKAREEKARLKNEKKAKGGE
jgi:hypothetical protein